MDERNARWAVIGGVIGCAVAVLIVALVIGGLAAIVVAALG